MASRSSTRRRVVVLAASLALPALLVFGFGHRGQHMARNLLVPGAGLWEEHLWVGLAFTVGMVAATVAWVRWGADWTVAAVVGGAVVASALWAPGGHDAPAAASPFTPARAAHEFPLVVLVVGALSWMRSLTARVPLLRRLGARRPRRVRAVDHARAVAVAQVAGAAEEAAVPADVALLARRARRVGLAARFRVGGDPFRRDHAGRERDLACPASLVRAEMGRASLRDAVLRGASLEDANLEAADLRGADLTQANATRANSALELLSLVAMDAERQAARAQVVAMVQPAKVVQP